MIISKTLLKFKDFTVRNEIETFTKYLHDLDDLAKKQKNELNEYVESRVAKSPNDADEIYDQYSDEYQMYNTRYIELTNNGSLVNSYSFFEHQLKHIFEILKKGLKVPNTLRRSPFSLSVVENLRNGIIDISGLDFSSLDKTWAKLDKYRIIRNAIVHNGANIIKNRKKILSQQSDYGLISSFAEIKIKKNGDFFIIDKEFVIVYFTLMGNYLQEMLKILNKLDNKNLK